MRASGPPPESLPPLREVIARHGLAPRRSLGQNFLLDLNLTRRIARAAGPMRDAVVVEVGPGPGGLTRALLETEARHVIAVERDPRCVDALQELRLAHPGRLTLLVADARNVDAAALARTHAGTQDRVTPKIVANLPFNAATPLLIRWLGQAGDFADLTLMFQKEVAQRLAAPRRTPAYGRLSVIAQWLCRVEQLFDVPPRAFAPPPKVTATLVRLTPRAEPAAPARMADLERVTAAAFGQRRKMLRSSLRTVAPDSRRLLESCGIDGTARAEELDVAAFCALAQALGGTPP